MENKITVKAIVLAKKNKVWDYYTEPNHITKWNFASDDWCCPTATNELKIGGKYKARMEAKDGSFGFEMESVYSEVEENKKLVSKLEDTREIEVLFKNLGDKTEVTILFDAENENPIEIQKGGWQAILNNFKKYTEEN